MSISFEDAVATLTAMFPDWDRETLSAVLVSNNYHVERTIESVLAMSGDASVEPQTTQPAHTTPSTYPDTLDNTHNAPTQQVFAPSVVGPPTQVPSSHTPHTQQGPSQSRAQAYRQRHRGATQRTHTSSSGGSYRGARCALPENFLRAPGYTGAHIITDEELALMLQNELFMREARAALGADFPTQSSLSHSHTTQQRPVSTATRSHTHTQQSSTESGGDLGILKSISSMGSAAKRNLVQLAQRFSTQRESSTQAATGQYSRESELGTVREFAPLVERHEDDDEDENGVEIISFDSHSTSRSRHVLQHDRENEENDFSSSNPLIDPKYRKNF